MKETKNRISIVLFILFFLITPTWATLIEFTEDGLGMDGGNLGASLEIDDVLHVSALTQIIYANSYDNVSTGSIYLNADQGLGVRKLDGGGSKTISGDGPDQDEAIVLDFTNVLANSISIGLNKYKEDRNDSVISVILSDGQQLNFDKNHLSWSDAITSLGNEKVVVNLGTLLMAEGVDENKTATRVYIAELTDHIYVNSLSYNQAYNQIPEPAAIVMFGLGGLIFTRRRSV